MPLFRTLVLLIFPIALFAQSQDSLVHHQVDSLLNVTFQLRQDGKLDEALTVNERIGKLAEENAGKESELYAKYCIDRCVTLSDKSQLDQAEKACRVGVDISKRRLGENHPEYAIGLFHLGNCLKDMGRFEEAEELFNEALVIQKDTATVDRIAYSATINGLGILYLRTGRLMEALQKFEDAAAIKKAQGHKDLDYAANLNNVGAVHYYTDNYREALTVWFEVLDIRTELVGKEHSLYAVSLNNIALCYQAMSKMELAEPMFLEAKDVWSKLGQTSTPWYAGCLNNLGRVYAELENYDQAEKYFMESLQIWEQIRGKEHPDYALALRPLADLYKNIGHYKKADSVYTQVLDIFTNTLGPEHPETAFTMLGQANLASMEGDFQKAEKLYLSSLEIVKNTIGHASQPYANILASLAKVYMVTGETQKADKLYEECDGIYKGYLGTDQYTYSGLLFDRSLFSESLDRYQKTEAYLREKASLDRSFLMKSLAFLSENELEDYVGTFEGTGHVMLNYLYRREAAGVPLDTLSGLATDFLLYLKGFVMTAASRMNHLANTTANSKALKAQVNALKSDWSTSYVNPDHAGRESRDLEEEAKKLEKELVRTIAKYDTLVQMYSWQSVRENLKDDEVAVEFANFPIMIPKPADSTVYAALVITPDQTYPVFIPLFEESVLDILNKGDVERRSAYVDALYAVEDRGLSPERPSRTNLYELIWAPVIEALPDDVGTIYFSPSGILHRLNLAAIAIDEESILSDRYQLIRMTSTRQVSEVSSDRDDPIVTDAVIFAGIDYELDSTMLSQSFVGEDPAVSRANSNRLTDSTSRGKAWISLKWTSKEGLRIADLLQTVNREVIQYEGSKATEDKFKSLADRDKASPHILHIATHGFFFPDPEVNVIQDQSGEGFQNCEHSMIRSGLVMAGGNHAWMYGTPVRSDMEDGILTAFEISQLDLSNTELVVLSACETGLGDIQGTEGVYGLQRAFRIAGAKYLIMSLWQVPDRETMDFMTTFYRNWLEEKMTIPDAFRRTQREMRDRFYNPYSWAGFVLME